MIFASCDSFLELEPETSLSSAIALDNIEGVDATLNGAYSVIHSDWVERQYVFAECLASNVSRGQFFREFKLSRCDASRILGGPF